jgi:RNA polymerase sigma-70 factor, sigma-B/F/G subfamily
MARHKVEISGVDTANIKVLSSEEMNELFKKMHDGDNFARDELVEGNLKLVLSILKMFGNKTDNMDDLFQIGCVGLLKAIDNFDPNYGVKFSTYCVPMIQGEVRRYIRDNNSIRVSRSIKDLAYKALREKESLSIEKGSEATIEDIAKSLGVTSFEVANALESRREPLSIFDPIYSEGGDTIYICDQIEDKKVRDNDLDIKMAVDNAIFELETREKYILDQRFIIGKTQTEIACELGISQAQISRIEKNAIDNLKKNLR